MKGNLSYILLLFLVIIPLYGFSQEENWEKPAGSIENAKVVIEKDKVINLRPVSRRFKSIRIEIPQPQKLSFDYNLSPTIDTLASLQVIVRPKTMRDQPLEKLYGLGVKLGYGNYQSPFVLLDLSNKRSDEHSFNAQLNHFSSGKGAVNEAPFYSTRFGLDGKYYMNKVTLFGNASFHNQSYRIYGYDPNEFPNIGNADYLKQSLNILNINLGFAENDLKNDSDQSFGIKLNLLSNNHFDREILFGAAYKLTWDMAQNWLFDLQLAYSLINQNSSSSTTISRHLAAIQPAVKYRWDSFEFNIGANGYFQRDPEDNLDSKVLVYPNLGVRYALNKQHSVDLRISGQVEQVTQNSMYRDNLFLDTLLAANNNINDFNASIALNGSFSETLGYNLGYEYAHYKRMMFFDNNPLDTARFVVLLDNSGVTRQRFMGNINYIRNENLSFNLGATYNIYSTSDVAEAWHKPQLEFAFGTRLRIIEKINVRFDYRLLTGIKARESTGLVKTLEPINDLNLAADLDLTERAGIFLEFRNILGQNYQLYNNYPVNGFQILGGFSYRF